MNFPECPEAAAMSFTAWLLTFANKRGDAVPTQQDALLLLAAVLALVRGGERPMAH